MSVSHADAELPAELPAELLAELLTELPVSGVYPDKDCLLSGKRTPSTAAGLLLKRHLCKSSSLLAPKSFTHLGAPYHGTSASSCIAHMVFTRAAHSEHATVHAFKESKPQSTHARTRILHCYLAYLLLQRLLLHVLCVSGRCVTPDTRLSLHGLSTLCCMYAICMYCCAKLDRASRCISQRFPSYFMMLPQPTLQHLWKQL